MTFQEIVKGKIMADCPQCGGTGAHFTETMARYGDEGVECPMCKGMGKKLIAKKYTREYYKIHLLDNIGKWDEWHSSNNGTDQWTSLAKIKAIITRGIQSGYKGKIKTAFENFEVVKFTEDITETQEVVSM